MTAATERVEISSHGDQAIPCYGGGGVKTNEVIKRGWLVATDTNGLLVELVTATGLIAAGIALEDIDMTGLTTGSKSIRTRIGVIEAFNSGGADELDNGDMGAPVFGVDNQTVAKTSGGGTRSQVGVMHGLNTETGKVRVFVGPIATAIAAANDPLTELASTANGDGASLIGVEDAGSLFTATTVEAALEELAKTRRSMHIPLTSFLDADGDPLAKFVSAGSPTFGFNLADSEALNLRWNNDANPGTALCQIALPFDLDDAEDMFLEFMCSKSGATVGDATTLTITAFIVAEGDLHDADANCGGITAALVGNAVAKTTDMLSLTITAANVPSGAQTMTFTVTPTAGLLGTDDLMIHSVKLRYVSKLNTDT